MTSLNFSSCYPERHPSSLRALCVPVITGLEASTQVWSLCVALSTLQMAVLGQLAKESTNVCSPGKPLPWRRCLCLGK